MTERDVKLTIIANIEQIPRDDIDNDEFLVWCERNDVTPLNGGRRGWSVRLNTYIRDADYVISCYGFEFLVTEKELQEMRHAKL